MVRSIMVREMREEDVQTVLHIEKESFPSPWSEKLFVDEFSRDFSHSLVACEEERGLVVGYIVFWTILDESHILNIAVSPFARRKGVGRALMRRCEEISVESNTSYIYLEVRKGNVPAMSLYSKIGYQTIGLRKGYYTDTGDDALIMMKRLEGSE